MSKRKSYAELKAEHEQEKQDMIRREINDPNTDYQRKYNLVNRDRIREHAHSYYLEHRERYIANAKRYRETHKAQKSEANREWYKENREMRKAYVRERYHKQKEGGDGQMDKDNPV